MVFVIVVRGVMVLVVNSRCWCVRCGVGFWVM